MSLGYDRLAWKRLSEAAKKLEHARKSGDAQNVETALEEFWQVVDASPLYPRGAEL